MVSTMKMHFAQRYQRSCLRCTREFIARGRYERFCRRCKAFHFVGLEEHHMIFPWT